VTSRTRNLALASALPLSLFSTTLLANELLDLKLQATGGAVTATFLLSEPAEINHFFLSEPDRFVVDFVATVPGSTYRIPEPPAEALILSIRDGRQADGRYRVVFDLGAPAKVTLGQESGESADERYSLRLTVASEESNQAPTEQTKRLQVPANENNVAPEASQAATSGSADVAAPKQAETVETDSFVFGSVGTGDDGADDDAGISAAQPLGWRPQLTRGLVESGILTADESRPGYNLHIQTVGTLTKSLSDNFEVRLGARFDAHLQGGDIENYDLAELDYDETWLRYRTDNMRFTVGAQRIIWGRADEISPTDRLSTRDLTRFILDDLPNRRRANPAVRLELMRDEWNVDLVYLPVFREAELPGTESIWSPVGIGAEGIAGLPLDPALSDMFQNVRLENEVSGDGGGGVRISRFGDNVDYAITLQRVRNPEPYFALSGTPTPGLTTLETVYPRTWVAGGDFGLAVSNWTFRFEGAWLSDSPYTDRNFRLQTTDAVNWVLGAEVFPGDRDTRLTLQLVGMHLLDADEAIDRENTLGLTGAIETPFADRRWRARLRWWAGLNRRDDYINPEIIFTGWEPAEIYLGANLFYGDDGTLGDFYNRNNMFVLGWRGRF
jgi:hypothetical protein